MKKILLGGAFAAVCVAPVFGADSPYARRPVARPVAEKTEPFDPSTPLGRVQEIAARLEAIEAATAEIGRALEAHKVPDYKSSVDEILRAAGTTRAEVARLGEIANGVEYIAAVVETIDANTQASATVANGVAQIAQILREAPTAQTLDGRFAELNAAVSNAFGEATLASSTNATAQLAAIEKMVDEKIAVERKNAADALDACRSESAESSATLKKEIRIASNIVILLGLGIAATFALGALRWLADKKRERDEEIQKLLAAQSGGSKAAAK